VAANKPAGKLRKLNPGGADKPAQIGSGMNFPVAKLIELLEPAQWEEFTEEWATSLKSYKDVERSCATASASLAILGRLASRTRLVVVFS
jgi:hypothetical protein